jgi:two-component system, OmpR family, phosphate regulon response regulator PhoB
MHNEPPLPRSRERRTNHGDRSFSISQRGRSARTARLASDVTARSHFVCYESRVSGLILLADDERDLVSTLEYSLQREGFSTRAAYTGKHALEESQRDPTPDLILLDLMLPDVPGTEVCRKLRFLDRTRSTPVIMLTAKADEVDRVVGFEVGADDYVVKPFSTRELLLRIRAMLRRAQPAAPTGNEESFGRLKLDRDAHRVWIDEGEANLTALEFKLLTVLLGRKGRVQTRERLLDDVWGIRAEVTTRTVDTHIKRLRQKLGAAGEYIETLRGVGYRFRAELGHEAA